MARPRTPLLSRRGIAEAALALIDSEGLDRLSMRGLARRLGVEAGSLYHHVSSRDDVLDEAIELINEEIVEALHSEPPHGNERWQDRLTVLARCYYRAFAAHPEMVAVAMRRPIQTPTSLVTYEELFALLDGAGWDAQTLTDIVASIDHLVLGAALEAFAPGFDRPADAYATGYPVLARVLGQADLSTLGESSFEFSLGVFIAGLGDPPAPPPGGDGAG